MRKNLLKSCLVAIGLVAGTMGAWADDTYTEVYSRSTTFGADNLWSESDIADWGGNTNLTVSVPTAEGGTGNGLGFDTNTTNSFMKEFSVSENSKVKYVITWHMGSSTGRDKNWSYIQLGDKVRLSWGYSYKLYLNTDGASASTGELLWTGKNTTYDKSIEIIFNTATKTVENFVFDGTDLTSKVSGALSGNFNAVSLGFIRGGSVGWTIPCYLKSIEVSECKQTVQSVDYTINYTCNGTTVYSEKSSSTLGAEITASSVVYDSDNNRYLTVAEECPTMVLGESDNVLEVPVRKPYSATLNVNTVVGGETVATKNVALEETDDRQVNWGYTYPIYVKKGNQYYKADNTEQFGETGTFTDGEAINKTVAYSHVDKSVVFYAEAEGTAVGTDVRYSNGSAGPVAAQNKRNRGISVGVLGAGTYEFSGVMTGNHKRFLVVREFVSEGDAAIIDSQIFGTLSYSANSAAFTLDKETALIINGPNSGNDKTNQSEDFDYVIIRQVSTPATVTAAEYATYVTKFDVVAPSDVMTYGVKVNADKSGVELSEIAAGTVIPAGKAILLNAAEGSYNFTVSADDAATIADNDLMAATADLTATGSEYCLTQQDGKVGFAQVKAGVTIPAGKAYLVVDNASAAKFMALGGVVTAISNVEAASAADGAYYTLQGVQTVKPTKGLYIHNGKKVIVK